MKGIKITKDEEITKNSLIGLIGVTVFSFFAILVPFLKVVGGFLKWTIIDDISGFTQIINFHWDEMSTSIIIFTMGIKYNDLTSIGIDSQLEIVWNILPLWGLIFIGFGLLGAILLAFTHIKVINKSEQSNNLLGFIGFIIGLVVTGIEYGLFLLLWLFEDWGEQPDLNYVLLACFVIGWVGLLVSYTYSRRISIYDTSYFYLHPTRDSSFEQEHNIDPASKKCSRCGHICKKAATFCESCGNHFE